MRLVLWWGLLLQVASVYAQPGSSNSVPSLLPESPESASFDSQGPPQNAVQSDPSSESNPIPSPVKPAVQATPHSQEQPKRILGVMPNYRAVSAGTIPPPPTPKQALWIATQNIFDYSSFVFVGITSLMSEGTDGHPQLGKGLPGFGRYYWRGFLDKTDGNYLVIFAFPTIFHQDGRYFAMGQGGFWKRATYSASRIFITPDYHGNASFNASELLGRGVAQAISAAYYPSKTRTAGALATKFGYALGRDALTNVFREFWPDIAVRVFHRHP